MVKVREEYPVTQHGTIDIERWLERIRKVGNRDYPILSKAVALTNEVAGEKVIPIGVTCLEQGLAMTEILADLIQDDEALAAASVYTAKREEYLTLEQIQETLGDGVRKLVEAVMQMDALRAIQREMGGDFQEADTLDPDQVEHLRKMLLTIVEDVRGVLIKLAEKTCILREAKDIAQEEQQRLANETVALYAPLANRLGIGQIKWELEDLSFRYLAPNIYKGIAKQLNDKRKSREAYIAKVIDFLNDSLKKQKITNFKVTGRVKHIYSIWRKMRRKDVSFEEIYDIRAVRVLVPRVKDCYAVLGVIHSQWQHVPKEFDDYIASPKENGYQSLHTAVVGPEGNVLEVQIRTWDMHEESELGVAAHWRYKEGGDTDEESALEKRIKWLRQLIEWEKDAPDDEDFVEEVRTEVLKDRVYVFTPKGDVKDLPMGATPLDFAYYIHSEIGHRCRGAKINGRMVPLNYQLKMGEQVEILTEKTAKPSRDWLIQHNGYIHTSRAHAHIQRWFKLQDFEKNAQGGRLIFEKEMKRIGLRGIDYNELLEHFKFQDQDTFFAAIGAGDLRLIHVLNIAQLQKQEKKGEEEQKEEPLPLPIAPKRTGRATSTDDIYIYGVDNLLTMIAGCCKPVPGDPITGYITQGRGVSIHRADCTNIETLGKDQPERIIDVRWEENAVQNYPVDIFIKTYERDGLLSDISKELNDESAKMLGMNVDVDRWDQTADIKISAEVSDLNSLGRLLTKIGQLPNVLYAIRQ